MTWNDQRKGWFGRAKPPTPEPIEPTTIPPGIPIPPFPAFSPTSIAQILRTSRQHVHYWMQSGKLEFFRDNIGDCYVLRDELVRFTKNYNQGRWSKKQEKKEE